MGNNKLLQFLRSDKSHSDEGEDSSTHNTDDLITSSPTPTSPGDASPYNLSPYTPAISASPYTKSPWVHLPGLANSDTGGTKTGLVGSLVRQEGHVYSLAAAGELLYTGSDSKNVRVWKNRREFAGFKSNSGLVKAIVIADDKIFTGHQDGKIRVWKASPDDPQVHKRVGTLPRLKDLLAKSINPSNYVEVRRHRNAVWIKHFDAVSCLSLDDDAGILYSGSWDRTVKVWRVSDSKCLESIKAHDDAVNTVAAAGFDGLLFTGSADGTVKVWQREVVTPSGNTRHVIVRALLRGESAVTAITVARDARVVYAGASDGVVSCWEWPRRGGEGPRHLGKLRAHKMAVLCLAAAGPIVVSGSADKTLSVWRRENNGRNEHVKVTCLTGHSGPVKCIAMEEDYDVLGGERRWMVYSGSLDQSVKVWRVAESTDSEAKAAAEQRMPSLSPYTWSGKRAAAVNLWAQNLPVGP